MDAFLEWGSGWIVDCAFQKVDTSIEARFLAKFHGEVIAVDPTLSGGGQRVAAELAEPLDELFQQGQSPFR